MIWNIEMKSLEYSILDFCIVNNLYTSISIRLN